MSKIRHWCHRYPVSPAFTLSPYTSVSYAVFRKTFSCSKLVLGWNFRFSRAASMNNTITRNVAPCRLVGTDGRFRDACCLHHEGWDRPDGGGIKHLQNIHRFLLDYALQASQTMIRRKEIFYFTWLYRPTLYNAVPNIKTNFFMNFILLILTLKVKLLLYTPCRC
jgi:hypothetical protein